MTLTPEEANARTPADRYRYADFLRVAAILVVVFGHWLLLIVRVDDGRLAYNAMLDEAPATKWLTWAFQVMPIFFIVGGYANALSLRSAQAKGTRGTDWLRARALRLYWPLLPVVVVWTLLGMALTVFGKTTDAVSLTTQVVLVPAWFLAAYLAIVSLAPLTYRLHERFGASALVAMIGIGAVVDLAHRVMGVPYIGWSTYLFVWVAVHQLGYFWQQGRLPSRISRRLMMGAAGYAALVILVFVVGYELAMVGTGGTGARTDATNTTPPSIALFALGIGQLGFLLAIEKPVTRWLHRPRVWFGVILIGSVIMTIYLWHMTAMVAVAAAAFGMGIWPPTDPYDATFWITRPLWFAMLLVALAMLVAAFRRFEQSPDPIPTTLAGAKGRIKAAVGVIATAAGLGLMVLGGLHSERWPLGLPLLPLVLFFIGLIALGVVRLTRRPST
jgi:peptidoglycan/LPS O-acetylase OafA/YrhL